MPKGLSPVFPVERVDYQSDFDVVESLRLLQASTEPPSFSSIVRPAVVGVCTDSSVRLWVQDQTLGVGRMNRFRPRFVGAVRQWGGKAVLTGRFDLTPFGALAMGVVAVALVSVAIMLIVGDAPRVPVALLGVGLAVMVTSSRRQYLEDVAVVSQALETALRRAPNMSLQPTSGLSSSGQSE